MTDTTDTTKALTQWAINKIKTEYPDDVALLVAVDGASVNGDGHGEPFDYFVPATERGNELAQTFIIGDVGNDLDPRSWERCEQTALAAVDFFAARSGNQEQAIIGFYGGKPLLEFPLIQLVTSYAKRKLYVMPTRRRGQGLLRHVN